MMDHGNGGERTLLISDDDLPRLHHCISMYAGGPQAAVADRLDTELARARVLPIAQMPRDVVRMGSRVEFEDERTGGRRIVTLVFPEEADAAQGRISVLAPIGAALLGVRAGGSAEWEIPHGRTARIRVIAVEEQPGAEAGSHP